MLVYATYEYYRDTFGGTVLDQDNFTPNIRKATQEINHATWDRAVDWWNNPHKDNELLSDCACAVAELIKLSEESNTLRNPQSSAGITLEITGRYHIGRKGTDTASSEGQASLAGMISAMIKKYLMTTGMLYKGVGDDCKCPRLRSI